jgi:hypothetical protein
MMNQEEAMSVEVKTKTATRVHKKLSVEEEKVYRMAHGVEAGDDLVLESKAQGNPMLAIKVAEIERQLFEKLSRAAATAPVSDSPVKSKIIAALKRK